MDYYFTIYYYLTNSVVLTYLLLQLLHGRIVALSHLHSTSSAALTGIQLLFKHLDICAYIIANVPKD